MQQGSFDIRVLLELVDRGYQFDPKVYPELEVVDPDKFGVNHSVLHMMKSVGVIAAEAEAFEHGKSMNHAALALATKKMLVNVLKLAAHLGISGDELACYIEETYRGRVKT
jgi:hypothetical protein